MRRRALVVHHAAWEGLAGFRAPIEAAGYAVEQVEAADPAFPALDLMAPDLLVLLGGPMAVYEQGAHPWIAGELERLAARIAARRPVLGLCLGAQMLAAALGARVWAGPVKEVGFAPLTLGEAGERSPLRHLAGVPVLHWHGDSFDLPPGVELLASTPAYPHQAFRRGDWLLALQCHPEMGADPSLEEWIAHAGTYLAAAGTDAERLRAEDIRWGANAAKAGRRLLDEWLAGLPAPSGAA